MTAHECVCIYACNMLIVIFYVIVKEVVLLFVFQTLKSIARFFQVDFTCFYDIKYMSRLLYLDDIFMTFITQ